MYVSFGSIILKNNKINTFEIFIIITGSVLQNMCPTGLENRKLYFLDHPDFRFISDNTYTKEIFLTFMFIVIFYITSSLN